MTPKLHLNRRGFIAGFVGLIATLTTPKLTQGDPLEIQEPPPEEGQPGLYIVSVMVADYDMIQANHYLRSQYERDMIRALHRKANELGMQRQGPIRWHQQLKLEYQATIWSATQVFS